MKAQNLPTYTVTVVDTSFKGYYFTVPIKLDASASPFDPIQMIMDAKGELVYYKRFTNGNTGDFKIQSNGLISYSNQNKFYMMDSTFQIKDSVRCKNGVLQDGHDMQILPNGHFLLLGFENVTMDLSSYAMFSGNGSPGSSNASVRCGIIQELDAGKNVVFEWRSKNYFSFTDVDSNRLFNPNTVDWTHCNAVAYDTDGNILLSSRHFNEITKINRSSGAVMWRLGGNANQFTFINDSLKFTGQHDIRRLANGNITLYDDGDAGPPVHPLAAKEYQLDEVNHIATLAWSYVSNPLVYSNALGNVQRLSNGNTLINYGAQNATSVFDVVDSVGSKKFSLSFTDTLISYRSFCYDTLPWKLNRPIITCTQISNQFYLDAGSGYSSYKWSNGNTSQQILINATGDYFVDVPKGNGGFIRSEIYPVNSLSAVCGNVSIQPIKFSQAYELNYNFVNGQLEIKLDIPSQSTLIEIFDANAKQVFQKQFNNKKSFALSISDYPKGIYFVRVNGYGKKFIKI